MNNKELHTVTSDAEKELVIQEARARKLAVEKSYLELIIQMMSRMSYSSGVNDVIEKLMINIMDVIGGTNIIIVYLVDNELFYADVYGTNMKLDNIDDLLIKQVFETHNPIEYEHDFCDTQMLTSKFTKASTWVYPLLVGSEIVGVIKMENMHIGMKELNRQLPIFFNYTAHILKNNIQNTSRLKQAYDRLNKSNSDLTREIYERKLAEKELVKAKEELEMRVTERTAELRKANEKLQEELIMRRKVEKELKKYREHLEDLVATRTCELEKAREVAEAASKTKSIFLANMSHELRTPLNAIIGFSEILKKAITDPRQKNYLNRIHAGGNTLLSMINEVLDLSKIQAGKMTLTYKPVSIKRLFEETMELFSQRLAEKSLNYILHIASDIPSSVLLDETRLRQVIINLIGNAVKFTHKGHISATVSAEYPKGNDNSSIDLIFSIKDTGIGILKDQMEIIFEPFEQQKGQKTSEYGGTGLGLSITRELITAMNGTISVESIPGEGSIFTVILKSIEICAASIYDQKETFAFDSVSFEKSRILIVDDIDYNRDLLRGYLSSYDFDIIEGKNGKEAVDKAGEYRPDLIILDIKMPHMDGYTASTILKKDEQLRHIPIIIVSASPLTEDEIYIKDTCDGYLRKPVFRSDLFREIMKYLPYSIHEEVEESETVTKLTQKQLKEKIDSLNHETVKKLCNAADMANIVKLRELINMIDDQHLASILGDYIETYDYDGVKKILKYKEIKNGK